MVTLKFLQLRRSLVNHFDPYPHMQLLVKESPADESLVRNFIQRHEVGIRDLEVGVLSSVTSSLK